MRIRLEDDRKIQAHISREKERDYRVNPSLAGRKESH